MACVGLMSAVSTASGHSDAVTCMTGPLKQEGDPTVSTYTCILCGLTFTAHLMLSTREFSTSFLEAIRVHKRHYCWCCYYIHEVYHTTAGSAAISNRIDHHMLPKVLVVLRMFGLNDCMLYSS
jgi:hypothetical protein